MAFSSVFFFSSSIASSVPSVDVSRTVVWPSLCSSTSTQILMPIFLIDLWISRVSRRYFSISGLSKGG